MHSHYSRSIGAISWMDVSPRPHELVQSQYPASVFTHTGKMKISGAFLAEKTAAVDNKLNVQGGVISKYKVGPDRIAQFDIVVLTQMDTGGSDSDRLVVIDVSPPNGGGPLHLHRELPANLTQADMGFACFQFRLTLNLNGRWIVAMSGAAGAVTLPLTVSGPSQRKSS